MYSYLLSAIVFSSISFHLFAMSSFFQHFVKELHGSVLDSKPIVLCILTADLCSLADMLHQSFLLVRCLQWLYGWGIQHTCIFQWHLHKCWRQLVSLSSFVFTLLGALVLVLCQYFFLQHSLWSVVSELWKLPSLEVGSATRLESNWFRFFF